MTDEGKSDIGFFVAAKLFLVFLLTVIPCVIVLWILTYAIYVDGFIRGQAFLLSTGCFFIGSSLVVFSGLSKEKVLLWASGVIIAICVFVFSGVHYVAILAIAYTVESLGVTVIIILISLYFYLQYLSRKQPAASVTKPMDAISLSRLSFSKSVLIGGVELVKLPEDHLTQSSDLSKYRPFLDLLRALTLANIPLALRLERMNQKTRVFYLTWATEETTLSEYIVRMEDNLRGNLQGMTFNIHPHFTGIKLA
ncbi:MAG: hypothetical protein ACTSSE_15005 [Candidatus Thorarchaeota archaeon]